MKYTMKIFDNETGKLVHSIDFNSLIAGYSTENGDGEMIGGCIGLTADSSHGVATALDSVDIIQQKILENRLPISVAYALLKGAKKTTTEVKRGGENNGES